MKENYLCFKANGPSTICLAKSGRTTNVLSLQTSTDKIVWTEFIPGQTVINLSDKDKIYFRGDNKTINDDNVNGNYYFKMDGGIEASGSIMSLLDDTGMSKEITCNYCFSYLFFNCIALTKAPELPATILKKGCYHSIFFGCINLTEAPELPATELADDCYSRMFYGCTSLIVPPALPENLSYKIYANMFSRSGVRNNRGSIIIY